MTVSMLLDISGFPYRVANGGEDINDLVFICPD